MGSEPASQAVAKLVDMANARGGHDNVTVLVLRAREPSQPSAGPRSRRRSCKRPSSKPHRLLTGCPSRLSSEPPPRRVTWIRRLPLPRHEGCTSRRTNVPVVIERSPRDGRHGAARVRSCFQGHFANAAGNKHRNTATTLGLPTVMTASAENCARPACSRKRRLALCPARGRNHCPARADKFRPCQSEALAGR